MGNALRLSPQLDRLIKTRTPHAESAVITRRSRYDRQGRLSWRSRLCQNVSRSRLRRRRPLEATQMAAEGNQPIRRAERMSHKILAGLDRIATA